MSRRTPVLVIGLTVGDYLVWNWSLNGSHDVIALISGLTLPPLVLVSLWVLAFWGMQALAVTARLARSRRAAAPSGIARSDRTRARAAAAAARRSAPAPPSGRPARAGARERSGKIAA